MNCNFQVLLHILNQIIGRSAAKANTEPLFSLSQSVTGPRELPYRVCKATFFVGQTFNNWEIQYALHDLERTQIKKKYYRHKRYDTLKCMKFHLLLKAVYGTF